MRNLPVAPVKNQPIRRQDVELEPIYVLPEDSASEATLQDYLTIVRRRKWLVIAPIFVILPWIWLTIATQKPIYEATTTLLIENTNPNVLPIQEISAPERSAEFYQTQYEIIRSREIAAEVVDKLALDRQVPEEDSQLVQIMKGIKNFPRKMVSLLIQTVKSLLSDSAVEEDKETSTDGTLADPVEAYRLKVIEGFRKSLQVEPKEGTKLVRISLRGEKPKEITQQVNLVAEVYMRRNLESKLDASQKAIAWLQEEATALREKINKTELALQKFKETKGLLPAGDFAGGRNIAPQQLESLSASYVETHTARIELQARIAELSNLSRQSVEEILQFPEISTDPSISLLKKRYLELQLDYTNLSKKFGEKHPQIIRLKGEIAEVRNAVYAEVRKVLSGMQMQYQALTTKEAALRQALNTQKTEVLQLSGDMTTYNNLKRSLEIDKELYVAVTKRLAETTLTEALVTNNVKVMEPAIVPTQPIPSNKKKMLLFGLLLSVGVGIGLAFGAEYLDKRFKSPDEVEGYLGIPFLGSIPHYKLKKSREGYPLITLQDPTSNAAEAYRALRTWIQLFSAQRPVKTLLITSVTPGEGKSTTAANLAITFAQLGQKVLLVDADLRYPSLHHLFDLEDEETGLTTILLNHTDWRETLQDTSMENLKVLLTGIKPPNPTELLSTRKMQTLIQNWKEVFDLIIFDSPVILSIPDVAILTPMMDGVLLVHYPAKGNKNIILEGKRLLERAGADILGIIFNNISPKEEKYYYSYRSYGYYPYGSSRSIRPLEGTTGFIDMRPVQDQEEWAVDAQGSPQNGAEAFPSTTIGKTARNEQVTVTIGEVRLQPQIAERSAKPGFSFLIMDIEVINEAPHPHLFHPESTTVYSEGISPYGSVLASVVTLDGVINNREELPPQTTLCRWDPVTAYVDYGIAEEEGIAPRSAKLGRLVYQVPEKAYNYIWVYESSTGNITIPFTLSFSLNR